MCIWTNEDNDMRILRSVESSETTRKWWEECGENERMVEVIETTNEATEEIACWENSKKQLLELKIRKWRWFWKLLLVNSLWRNRRFVWSKKMILKSSICVKNGHKFITGFREIRKPKKLVILLMDYQSKKLSKHSCLAQNTHQQWF